MRSLAIIMLCTLLTLTLIGCQRAAKPPVMEEIFIGPFEAIDEFLWLSDNRTILFTAESEGAPRLHLLDVFSGKGSELDKVAGVQLEAAVSRQGSMVAYVGGTGAPELYLHDLATMKTDSLELPLSGDYPSSPKFSPDGKLIAFYAVIGRSDAHSDIYQSMWLYNLSAKSALLVSPTGGSVRFLGFSNDSARLYFLYTFEQYIHSHNFRYDVWEVDTATGQQRQLSQGGLIHNFAGATQAPTSERFVFGTWEAVDIDANIIARPRSIYSLDVSLVELRPLLTMGSNGEPQYSPNGKQILFLSDRGKSCSGQDVYLMDHEGKNVKRLTSSGFAKTSPRWSGDGKLIAFIELRGETPEIVVMDAKGTILRRIRQRSLPPGT